MKPVWDQIRNRTSSVAYFNRRDHIVSRASLDALRMVDEVFDMVCLPRQLVLNKDFDKNS